MKTQHTQFAATMKRAAREAAVVASMTADELQAERDRLLTLRLLKRARAMEPMIYAARQAAVQTSVRAIRHD